MNEKIYVFRDHNTGDFAVFTTRDAVRAFMKDYVADFWDFDGTTPEEGEDYSLHICLVNPSFKEWSESPTEKYE